MRGTMRARGVARRARRRATVARRRRAMTRAASVEDVPPEDLALVVELLDSESGEELGEKVDLVAKNGLLTKGGRGRGSSDRGGEQGERTG